ncbi:MAG TPA: ABC transporter ATP-binding protein [Gemmatimonadales bacterium]
MASVTVRQLTKVFDPDQRAAVRDLSLAVADGEFLVLLGPSGCGKTTVLRCIAGLEDPTSGDVVIGERVVTRVPPAERDVAMVFQNHALYPHLTVRDNLGFALKMRRLPRADIGRRVDQVAKRLRIADLLDRRPAELSGGERQRVALGRAIAREPRAFLFDEPLAHLDAHLRVELRAELLGLHRSLKSTMIYVTHDQVEAMTMGQRIAVLHEGRLRQVGTPAEVYDRPADVFVARLLGAPGMNVLTGMAIESGGGKGDGGRVVECGSLRIPLPSGDYFGEIQLGLRPEHVGLCGVGQGVGDAAILIVEPLGSETLVHLDAEGQRLIARLPGLVELAVGELVGVKFERRRLHMFDAAGGRLPVSRAP